MLQNQIYKNSSKFVCERTVAKYIVDVEHMDLLM